MAVSEKPPSDLFAAAAMYTAAPSLYRRTEKHRRVDAYTPAPTATDTPDVLVVELSTAFEIHYFKCVHLLLGTLQALTGTVAIESTMA
jgi:hypothetical protein